MTSTSTSSTSTSTSTSTSAPLSSLSDRRAALLARLNAATTARTAASASINLDHVMQLALLQIGAGEYQHCSVILFHTLKLLERIIHSGCQGVPRNEDDFRLLLQYQRTTRLYAYVKQLISQTATTQERISMWQECEKLYNTCLRGLGDLASLSTTSSISSPHVATWQFECEFLYTLAYLGRLIYIRAHQTSSSSKQKQQQQQQQQQQQYHDADEKMARCIDGLKEMSKEHHEQNEIREEMEYWEKVRKRMIAKEKMEDDLLLSPTQRRFMQQELSSIPTSSISSISSSTTPSTSSTSQCASPSCPHTSTSLQLCSRCRSVSYCSSTCQRQHWSQHKQICVKK